MEVLAGTWDDYNPKAGQAFLPITFHTDFLYTDKWKHTEYEIRARWTRAIHSSNPNQGAINPQTIFPHKRNLANKISTVATGTLSPTSKPIANTYVATVQ